MIFKPSVKLVFDKIIPSKNLSNSSFLINLFPSSYIHCGRKQLKDIPNFTRITNTFYDELVLIDNQITEIPPNAFQGLRVKRVNLSGNKIRSISPRAFIELSNYLEELTIEFDSNFIHQIPEAIKINLINLRSLKLIDLNLSTIENRTFIKFRKLEQLTIRKSNIRSIESDGFISLKNLRYLNLDQNQLTDSSWEYLVKHLPHLEYLSLSQNNFHSLKTAHLKSLKYLDLSSNGLQSIDTNLFHSLEKLYLQNNELNSLQLIFLSSLKNLKELNFDFNRLTFLPEKIFQLNSRLIYLSLQGNDLNYLTNYSLFGLKNLIQLNLARNRLQFQINQRPFQDLNSLKILNLDRNSQLNLTKEILEDLSGNLIELSIQNCNLTSWNYSLKFLSNLQRLKLSSNCLKDLPKDFLNPSVISVDLQRNLFTSIPDLFESNHSKLSDLDLSSNKISILQKNQLSNYPNLKTIGLTGNPLDCNCHLRWIKQWLEQNYDKDLVKFLQWTCAQPTNLFGKQLIAIHEQDMICPKPFDSSLSELIINDPTFNSNGLLILSWEYMLSSLPKYYRIEIYDENHRNLIYQHLVNGDKRSIEIDSSKFPSINIICINIQERKSCRKVSLPSNNIKSASLILSSNKHDDNEQFLYLIGGILLGAILVCTILIIICYCRLRTNSKKQFSNEKSVKTFFYHPLNIISYPQQQSNHTSECSLHSSTDTSHLTNDLYHIYQQIPSILNCQIYPTRTHVLV